MNRMIFYLWMGFFLLMGCSNDDGNQNADNTAPVCITISPTNGNMNVLPQALIQLTYDEDIWLAENHNIQVNGLVATATTLKNVLTINITLKAGDTYNVSIPYGSVMDASTNFSNHLTFSFKTVSQLNISASLVSSNPSPQAVKLYNYLKDNYGTKNISSTMANVNWNINEAEWVKQHTGKYPAMATFDYIHLMNSPANWIDYSNTTVVEDWWDNKGLVSACWHWNIPTANGAGDYTYDPTKTTFSAANATVDGTWENTVVKADLEKMAGYLKLLKDKNIPLIWRPLHEGAGNIYEYANGTAWFWWGAKGADAYKKLWIYMFNYFEAQGLNNLIWVWTTQTKDNAFYPGDQYVDIVGRDIYNKSDATAIATEFASIQEAYPTKMVTLSECGNVANISSQWTAGATWSFFMPWYDYDRTLSTTSTAFASTSHGHANAAWWIDAFAQDYVITRDEMPSLK